MKSIFAMAVALLLTTSCTRTVYVAMPIYVPANLGKLKNAPTIAACRAETKGECLNLETLVKIRAREIIYRNNIERLVKRIESTQ